MLRSTTLVLSACILSIWAAPAYSADRWEEAVGGAVAILPTPQQAKGITGASLYCSEQRWGFLFRVEPDALPSGKVSGTIAIADTTFQIEAETLSGAVKAVVPVEILGPLKEGTRMTVAIGDGEAGLKAAFGLRGSGAVISAIAPRCSQIDMTGYDRVLLSESGPAVDAAGALLADEIKLFRDFTTRQPVLAATIIDLVEGRQLLFATVCGSTNYYGESGCNLSGHAKLAGTGEWLPVYNTEGLNLFVDPKADNGGWPNLVTVPMVNGLEATHWVWSGSEYQLLEQVMAEEDMPVEEEEQGDTSE